MPTIALSDYAADVTASGYRRDRGRRRRRRDLLTLLSAAVILALAAGSLGVRLLVTRPAPPVRIPARTPAAAGPVLPVSPRVTFSRSWMAAHPIPAVDVRAVSGVLIDVDSRQVLWARDDQAARAPASLAKMMTVMVAADLAPLDTVVDVPVEATQVEPNRMGLDAGERLTVRDLMAGIFLWSGNDAAETLARTLAPRDRFITLMNRRAAELGLVHTHFSNPTGLDDPGLRSTAADLAAIAVRLVDAYPELLAISGRSDIVIPAGPTHKAYYPHNLNGLVRQYPGATGLKTGFTDDAGQCLAASVQRGDRRLVAILLDSDVFVTDAIRLFDAAWSVPAPAAPRGSPATG